MAEDKRRIVRPSREDDRIGSQLAAIEAITKGTNFGVCCFLAKAMIDDFHGWKPGERESFEFTVKGVLRIEMDKLPDQGEKEYRFWRRLFGTTTGEKTGRRAGEFVDKPASWKSRVLFKGFDDGREAHGYLSDCPLARWEESARCPLAEAAFASESGPLLVLQVHDVEMSRDQTFVGLLRDFLAGSSQILRLVEEHSCLSAVGGER